MYSWFLKYRFFQTQKELLKSENPNMLKAFWENNCLFFHIPKTGGMSISKALFGDLEWGHKDVFYYQKVFGKNTFQNLYKFTVVRNPFHRLSSAYHFLKAGGINETDRMFCDNHLAAYSTFEEFVIKGLKKQEIKSWVHFLPQHAFILNNKNELVVDFVAKLESLDADFKTITHQLKKEASLPHINKGSKQTSAYSLEMEQVVKFVYQKDFELFYPDLL